MTTLDCVVNAFIASKNCDVSALGRLEFWTARFGQVPLDAITPEQVDAAIVELAQRGKLRAGRGMRTVKTGQPLKPATINRYIKTLSQVYAYARRQRLLPRAFVPPTKGVELEPETVDHDRFFTEKEVDRLVAVARVVDNRKKQLPAIILMAAYTGLRKTNLLELRWRDVDLDSRTVTVALTKNGEPMTTGLSPTVVVELKQLGGSRDPDAYVFQGELGRPRNIRRAFQRCMDETGLTGRTFHSLRHSFGYQLAKNGVNQAVIMKLMGHKSLTASARYMHSSVDDKRAVIDEVFG